MHVMGIMLGSVLTTEDAARNVFNSRQAVQAVQLLAARERKPIMLHTPRTNEKGKNQSEIRKQRNKWNTDFQCVQIIKDQRHGSHRNRSPRTEKHIICARCVLVQAIKTLRHTLCCSKHVFLTASPRILHITTVFVLPLAVIRYTILKPSYLGGR